MSRDLYARFFTDLDDEGLAGRVESRYHPRAGALYRNPDVFDNEGWLDLNNAAQEITLGLVVPTRRRR